MSEARSLRFPRRRLVIIAGLVILASIVGLAALIIWRAYTQPPPGYATGDPLDIELVGVWAADDVDVYDASGKKSGETLGMCEWPESVTPGDLLRDFIFRSAGAMSDVTLSDARICRAGLNQLADAGRITQSYGDSGFCVGFSVPSKYTIRPFGDLPFLQNLFAHDEPVTQVDVTLLFWQGPRGTAEHTFIGPFVPGKTITDGGTEPASLAVSEYYGARDDRGTWVHYTTKKPFEGEQFWMLAYDLAGRRMEAYDVAATLFPSPGIDLTYTIPGKAPGGISAITFGEKPREKTFHNITVAYPGRVARKYPQYLEEMAKRLNMKPDDVGDVYDYDSDKLAGKDPMKVIDLVRGWEIDWAWSELQKTRLSDNARPLTAEETARLEEAARTWSAAEDSEIRLVGLELGVRIGSREAIERAIAALRSQNPSFSRDLASELLRQSGKLTPGDVAAVRNLVLDGKKPEIRRPLVTCLVECPLPEATDVLAELAKSEDSVLWWRPLRSPKVLAALGMEDGVLPLEWPLDLKARFLIASDFKRPDLNQPEVAERARSLLPALVTNYCREADYDAFMACLELLARECERAAATDAMIDYLRRLDSYDQDVGRSADLIVRYLNLWNGVDIAGLGPGTGVTPGNMPVRNWRRVALDALEWRDTGKVRQDVPDGYEAKNGDLRMALYEKDKVENAAIGLWINDPSPAVIGIPQTMLCSDAVLIFSITSGYEVYSQGESPPDYQLMYLLQTGAQGGFGDVHVQSFTRFELPKVFECDDGWVITVDNALAPDDVLGGTEAFRKWWERFGPPPAGK